MKKPLSVVPHRTFLSTYRNKMRPKSMAPYVFIYLLLSVCMMRATLLYALPVAEDNGAPHYNARIRGMRKPLRAIVSYVAQNPCYQSLCTVKTKPFELSIASPHTGRFKTIITDVTIQNPTIHSPVQSLNAAPLRPVLLKGFIRPADTTDDSFIPVSGAIFRDSRQPNLNLVIPLEHLKRRRASGNFAVLNAPISSLSSNRFNARSSAATAYAFQGATCGTSDTSSRVTSDILTLPVTEAVQSLETYNAIYLATDYDTLYPSRAGCSSVTACNNKILSDVHNASVFYQNQLGYAFEVEHQFASTSYSGTTVSEAIIDEFSLYNSDNRSQYFDSGTSSGVNQVDIFSLFTGKSMDEGVIGIAYVATACKDIDSEYAATVVEHRSTSLNPVILAHEVGHSLNANHTASGIMQASLGSPPPSSFSSSSVSTMSSYLSTYYGECRQGTTSGGSDTPSEDPPTTLGLSLTRLSRRDLMVSITPTSLESGCTIQLQASPKKSTLDTSTPIYEVTPTETTTELIGTVRFKVKTTANVKKPTIFFKARYVCSGEDVREVSKRRSFNANRGKRLVKKARSKRRWITAFKNTLTQQ